ncbi:conserved oligomeric Golgi complex subunit 5-like [Zingiber officinale]|uniref:Conserved oligomeric Golgi complex subunit 5 n=1 Tax=Zingiber officinale TaxID=94328 RepID=A0A8J5E843_ZINOF|nr:conserved oligomeric Golgi complex subunit 5-like [Zingiber officinale]KAG6466229.1 hypothetical protein ZIOFF_075947 [Zingiber officinale]
MASPGILPSSPLQKLGTFKSPSAADTAASSADASSSPSPLEAFASDPIFSAFLSPEFDSVRFSSQALSSGSAAALAESLQDAIRLLQSHLRKEVLSRHPALLAQLASLRSSESSLAAVRSGVESLQSSLRRSRLDLAEPRQVVRAHTIQLSNLHAAADLLASAARLLRLSRRLRDLVSSGTPDRLDLSKAAEMHHEIELLYQERGLSGISVVEDEIRWLSEIGSRLRTEAMKTIERGMDESNQNDIWCGLQVFYNLGELRSAVDTIVSKYKGIGVKSVGTALDMKAISTSSAGFGPGGVQRSGTPQIGGGKRATDALWERMGKCMDELHKVVTAVWHLQTVLSKKKVPFTQVLFLNEVWQEGDPLLTERVWEALVKTFASQIKSAFTASSFVKEAFTHGYPKLFSMIENLLERISRNTNVKGVLPALNPEGKEQLVAAINIFQTAFLALCLSRLSDNVNSIFAVSNRGSIPSKEQISRIILRIQEEIEVVRMHGHLILLVLHEVGKVLLLLAERAEYQISTGPEACQVTGPATAAQIKNFSLCLHLQEIHARVSHTTSSLPAIASDVLSPSLGVIYGVACDSVTSLFKAMLDQLESYILQIHEQDYGSAGIDSMLDNNATGYMDGLQKCSLHFRNEFLSKLLLSSGSHSETICTMLARRMASRILIFFIRHASLLRPLSESGKLKLARDMAELEHAVGQNLFPVEQLGAPYRALRAFRPIIFLETDQLAGSPLLKDLPPSVILHHLYSRAPDELQSPLQSNQLTPKKYSIWLDSHGEDQIWKGIKATLDDYERKVRARGDEEFSPVYPLMLQIGSSLVENTSQ